MTSAYVYLLTNAHHNVLYTGSTTQLKQRVYQHKAQAIPGFTKKYNVDRLVYFEIFVDLADAQRREKEIKGWKRIKKDTLIEAANPGWLDLYDTLQE